MIRGNGAQLRAAVVYEPARSLPRDVSSISGVASVRNRSPKLGAGRRFGGTP
jgi:hypothetical protein